MTDDLREQLRRAVPDTHVELDIARLYRRGRTRRHVRRAGIWMSALVILAGVTAGVLQLATGPDSPRIGPGDTQPEDPHTDAQVVFDDDTCRSTIPPTWPAATPLRVQLDNRTATMWDLIIGSYDPGYDRRDMLEAARNATDRMAAPAFANDEVMETARREVLVVDLDPGRRYVVCLEHSSAGPGAPTTMVVLPDLVLTD